MAFIILILISIGVSLTLSLLDRDARRYYYFGGAIMTGGVVLSFWSYQDSVRTTDDHVSRSVQIVSVSKREFEDTLVFETVDSEFLFPGSKLDEDTKNKLLSIGWANDPATIWLSNPSSRIMMGIETRDLLVDPKSIGAMDRDFSHRLFQFGFVVFGLGILLIILNFVSLRRSVGRLKPD